MYRKIAQMDKQIYFPAMPVLSKYHSTGLSHFEILEDMSLEAMETENLNSLHRF